MHAEDNANKNYIFITIMFYDNSSYFLKCYKWGDQNNVISFNVSVSNVHERFVMQNNDVHPGHIKIYS